MTHRIVRVEIDELVLHGWSRSEAALLERALRTELTRLLSAPGALDGIEGPLVVSRVDAGAVRSQRSDGPAALGRRLGQSVQGALSAPAAPQAPTPTEAR